MSKKYICFGGYISSQSDADRHYISAHRLADLYHVNPAECLFVNHSDHPDYEVYRGYTAEFLMSLKKLYPRFRGDYDKVDLDT